MNYMLLLHSDERAWGAMTDTERQTAFTAYMQFNVELAKAGALKAGEQLMPSAKTKTLRKKGASIVTTDGPFAEAREQLGGYYLLSCETEAQVLELAAKCPVLQHGGSVEVRPVIDRPTAS